MQKGSVLCAIRTKNRIRGGEEEEETTRTVIGLAAKKEQVLAIIFLQYGKTNTVTMQCFRREITVLDPEVLVIQQRKCILRRRVAVQMDDGIIRPMINDECKSSDRRLPMFPMGKAPEKGENRSSRESTYPR